MEDTELELRPNDLLVWFDETGNETLSDTAYPIFGLGGCAVMGDRYIAEIDAPWRELKNRHFGGAETALHAATVDLANTEGIAALGDFFRTREFARLATVITSKTRIEPMGTSPYLAISLAVVKQIEKLVLSSSFYRFVFIVESSHRGNPLMRAYLSEFWPILDLPNGPDRAPVERCFMPKATCNPGLEIADFVMHAAGRQSFNDLRNHAAIRKDFQVVFQPTPKRFADFVLITDTLVTPKTRTGA
jgi:Protein of unknown function (DUF3800)